MAADYFVISRTNRPNLGAELIVLANMLRDVRDRCDALNGIGQHQFDGSDYTVLEAQFGLTAGEGDDLLSLLANVHTILNTNTDVTGANRLSFLDQFCDRVSGQ